LIRDIAEILNVAVFFDRFDDFAVTELSESGDDGDGDGGAQRVAMSTLGGMLERGEAIHEGLPGHDAAQDVQFVGGIGQMSMNPLWTEGILKCVCDHGHGPLVGVEKHRMLLSLQRLSHLSEVS
jgi:hypothetical protein